MTIVEFLLLVLCIALQWQLYRLERKNAKSFLLTAKALREIVELMEVSQPGVAVTPTTRSAKA